MKNKLSEFYLKSNTFLIFAIASMLGWIGWGISTIITDCPIKLTIFAAIFFSLTAGMTFAYAKGYTNIQKMLFGSLTMFLIIDYIEVVDVHFTYGMTQIAIIDCFILTALVVFFICHALQQQDHIGKSIIIVINQCLGIVVFLIVVFIIACVVLETVSLTDYTFSFAIAATTILIACMETRISKYKQIRAESKDKGTWNDQSRAEAKLLFKI